MSNDSIISEAVTVAIRHIGTGTYSSGKILLYLQQKGYNLSVSQAAVEEVISRGYIDDHRAAAKVLRVRTGKKQESRRLLSQRLSADGISQNVINEVLSDLPSDVDTCLSLLNSVYPVIPAFEDPQDFILECRKLAVKRGYSVESFSSAFNKFIS